MEGFHLSETMLSVTAVTTRLVGVVGANRSGFGFTADAVLPLKSSNVSKTRAAVAMLSRAKVLVVMLVFLLTNRSSDTCLRAHDIVSNTLVHHPPARQFFVYRKGRRRLPELTNIEYCNTATVHGDFVLD